MIQPHYSATEHNTLSTHRLVSEYGFMSQDRRGYAGSSEIRRGMSIPLIDVVILGSWKTYENL